MELHHIDLADVWVFGDTSNDNEMIRMAGLGICMENGSEDTKQIADMITEKPCDEVDGQILWKNIYCHYFKIDF